MAVIKQLFDNTINDKIYPVTHINAVLDNNGNNIADLLAGAGSLVVNFTFDDGEEAFTADQTQSAILDAYESGKVVFGKILPSDPSSMLSPGQIFQLSRIEAHEGGYIFFSHLSELDISANLSCDWGDIYYYPSQTALAPTSSPSFVGSPTAPTPLASSNNNSIATTAFVKNALENVQVTIDATLDDASENPVQNKVISSRIANIEKVTAESLNDLEERKIDAAQAASVATTTATTVATNVATAIVDTKADKVVRVDKTSDPATAFTIDANKIYDFGERVSLEISLATYSGNGEPMWTFIFVSGTTPTSLDIPATWEILNGSLDVESGYTYEFNIQGNLCAYGKFKTT